MARTKRAARKVATELDEMRAAQAEADEAAAQAARGRRRTRSSPRPRGQRCSPGPAKIDWPREESAATGAERGSRSRSTAAAQKAAAGDDAEEEEEETEPVVDQCAS